MRLLPYGDGDLALTEALEHDPLVMRHLGGVAPAGRTAELHRRRLAAAAGGDHVRTIWPDGADAPAGLVAIWRWEHDGARIAEIGAMLLPGFHGRRTAVTAAGMLIDEVGGTLWRADGLRRLDAFTQVDHVAAAALSRSLGFTNVGEVDLDYEGVPLRCHHWVRALTPPS